MGTMEKTYQEAVKLDDIPCAIILTAQDIAGKFSCESVRHQDISQQHLGKFNYAKTFGQRTLLDVSKKAIDMDDIMAIFSCTKIITTIAVLQCVENGHFALDEDVTHFCRRLARHKYSRASPRTGSRSTKAPSVSSPYRTATLTILILPNPRGHLLTHSSGYRIDGLDPLLQQWRALRNDLPKSGGTVESRCDKPLSYQPSESWSYGPSLDWAGKAVERASGETLEKRFHKHTFVPLGVTSGTFWSHQDTTIQSCGSEWFPTPSKGGRPFTAHGSPAASWHDPGLGQVVDDDVLPARSGQGLYPKTCRSMGTVDCESLGLHRRINFGCRCFRHNDSFGGITACAITMTRPPQRCGSELDDMSRLRPSNARSGRVTTVPTVWPRPIPRYWPLLFPHGPHLDPRHRAARNALEIARDHVHRSSASISPFLYGIKNYPTFEERSRLDDQATL